MKIYGINGSPRKNGSTEILLNKALEGAASQGAEVELIHLYDLIYKGCRSCFACKEKEGTSFGKCVIKDDLTLVLKGLKDAYAIIFGSPVYYGSITGEMQSFIERFAYPYMQYTLKDSILFGKQIPTGFIYTMNGTEEMVKQFVNVDNHFSMTAFALKMLTGYYEPLYVYDTILFNDYSRYISDGIDEKRKAQTRKDVFPADCEKAYDMGIRFAKRDVKFEKVQYS